VFYIANQEEFPISLSGRNDHFLVSLITVVGVSCADLSWTRQSSPAKAQKIETQNKTNNNAFWKNADIHFHKCKKAEAIHV
jgi:hypothetical protein